MAESREEEALVVLTTAPDRRTAESLAEAVVGERLAACVNILPGATSVYRWEGDVQKETEVVMVAKTTGAVAPALQERLVELHPYEVPEVVVLPIEGGSAAYLAWVREAVGVP